MVDRTDAEGQLLEVTENMGHESGPDRYCRKCQLLDAESRVRERRVELEAEIEGLRGAADDAALDAITVEGQQSDLERLTQRITDLEMDRAMFEAEVERLWAQVEESLNNEASLRSQRNALLAANEELQDVIRQLV